MNYAETIDYLFSRLPMFHRIGAAALKPGLDNITALCKMLDNPQDEYPTIHIAGTNGKGSTAHFIASILQEAGYKVGLFSSPHLKDFRERIKINGEYISEKDVIRFVESNKAQFETIEASFFEYTTAMCFQYFKEQKVDIAVIETGLGGRLDSTNILYPDLCVITSISLDHTNLLGDTVQAIAAEKAGIIKSNIPVVVAENSNEAITTILNHALPLQAEVLFSTDQDLPDGIELGLKGNYQQQNALTALTAAEVLVSMDWDISEQHVEDGLKNVVKNTRFAGRWQQLSDSPKVLCDVAHNEGGIQWVVKQLKEEAPEKLHMVFGMVSDKDTSKILAMLPKEATYYFCNADIPRALPAVELKEQAAAHGLLGESYISVNEALSVAKKAAGSKDLVFVGGSVFVVAEII